LREYVFPEPLLPITKTGNAIRPPYLMFKCLPLGSK
jgi:hypothetical protein